MGGISRRQFLAAVGAMAACGVGVAARRGSWRERPPQDAPAEPPGAGSVEASYYASFAAEGSLNCASCHDTSVKRLPVSYCHVSHTGSYVRCNLCPHRCIIADGERGHCRVRENRGGRLYSMAYGNPCAVQLDPIEKKPFYHFLPGAAALSLATAGCNLRCLYCQNWTFSQVRPEDTHTVDLPPTEVVRHTRDAQAPVIAYTYSEPTVFFEYMLATARLARGDGIRSVVISAGYINPEPLRELCRVVDAIKIDLKAYDAEFYQRVCGGELEHVLRSIQTIYEMGVHLEIVNLVVPTLNDSLEQLRALAAWVAGELGPDVPLHFSRFHPTYKLANLPLTPVETLEQARDIALAEGVRFVYLGNVAHPGNHTYCPACGRRLVARAGFGVMEYNLKGDACPQCGEVIPGVWWAGQPNRQLGGAIWDRSDQ